jgi:hypothetical protein
MHQSCPPTEGTKSSKRDCNRRSVLIPRWGFTKKPSKRRLERAKGETESSLASSTGGASLSRSTPFANFTL